MKFGNQFALRQNVLWTEFYLDYNELKSVIKSIMKRRETESKDIKKEKIENSINFVKVKKSAKELMDIFFESCKRDLVKVENWYFKVETQCHKTLSELQTRFATDDVYDLSDQIMVAQFSEKIISLKDFATLNYSGFCKIVKKFKKCIDKNTEIDELMNLVNLAHFRTSKGLDGLEAKIHPTILYGKSDKKPLGEKKKSVIPEPVYVDVLDIKILERGKIYCFWVGMTLDPFGSPISVPVMIARGVKKGPILGIISALHGNEINGIPLIHRLFEDLDVSTIIGTVVAIPVANPTGYVLGQRQFNDGVDLNRLFPGRKNGTCSSQFANQFFTKIVKQLEYLIDLHTASSGRVNSLFVRADMNDPISSRLAYLQNPQIVCHQPKQDKSVRGAAASIGIKSIAVEIGNPFIFQKRFIKHALVGVTQIMSFLKMIPYDEELQVTVPTLCSSHTWIHTTVGGLLTIFPNINTWVKKGETYAIVQDIFGNTIKEYKAEKTAIVVGKATSPINQTGDRMILFGVIEEEFIKEGEKRIITAGE